MEQCESSLRLNFLDYWESENISVIFLNHNFFPSTDKWNGMEWWAHPPIHTHPNLDTERSDWQSVIVELSSLGWLCISLSCLKSQLYLISSLNNQILNSVYWQSPVKELP